MNLAGRLTLGFATVGVAVSAAIGGLSFVATDRSLDTETRDRLMDATANLAHGVLPEGLPARTDGPDGDADADDPSASPTGTVPGHGYGSGLVLAQLLSANGTASGVDGLPVRLPVDDDDRAVARASVDHDLHFREVTVGDDHFLMLTRSRGHGAGAVQVARNLSDSRAVLTRLAGSLLTIALVVSVAAAVAGFFLARALTRRLVQLTGVAERVSATGRLDVDVPADGADEVGRLGAAFDAMLARLARSKDDQQRLVQNAGHELRTPLTSIRTNVSLLRRADELSADERGAVIDDLAGEARELTGLIDELVELATDRRADEPEQPVDLVATADRVAARAGRRSGREVHVSPTAGGADAVVVRGRPQALERALTNLVDNAIKFDRAGTAPVEVVITRRARDVRVEVRDRGPGIATEDLDRVFDRFHRATSVRSLPGSGLGLSIVQEVVAGHDGAVFATHRDGGGAVIGFTLPGSRFQPGSYPG